MAKDPETDRPTYEPESFYYYTWPGQPETKVLGKVLTEIVKGADPSLLGIRQASVVSPDNDSDR